MGGADGPLSDQCSLTSLASRSAWVDPVGVAVALLVAIRSPEGRAMIRKRIALLLAVVVLSVGLVTASPTASPAGAVGYQTCERGYYSQAQYSGYATWTYLYSTYHPIVFWGRYIGYVERNYYRYVFVVVWGTAYGMGEETVSCDRPFFYS